MERQFKIRPVSQGDRNDLIDNYFSYWDELSKNPNIGLTFLREKPTFVQECDWFKNMMDGVGKNDVVASVAEKKIMVRKDDEVASEKIEPWAIGLCNATRLTQRAETMHIAELGIAIRDGHRGEGIGEALMRDVIERSKEKFEILKLAVFGNNQRAQRLYEKVGFKEYGRMPGEIKRGEKYIDEVLMYLNLKEQN